MTAPADGSIGTVERAFQLAREGRCRNVDDLRRELKREQYEGVDEHLSSRVLRDKLTSMIVDALVR